MTVGHCVFVCMYALSVYFTVPVYFGDWYLAGALSIFTLDGNQETTQKSTYKKETLPEINGTEEIPEGNFTNSLNLTKQYQRKYPSLIVKYKEGTYQNDYFSGGNNIDLNIITCEDKIVII